MATSAKQMQELSKYDATTMTQLQSLLREKLKSISGTDELTYYSRQKYTFKSKYPGKFLLIKGNKLINTFDSESEAEKFATKEFGINNYLIHNANELFPSLAEIADHTKVSNTWLTKFRDGQAVCMNIMNRLANYFGYKYIVTNYDEEDLELIE